MEVATFAMEVENRQLAKELKAAKKAKGRLKLESKRKEFDKKRWKATTESMLRAWPGVPATIYNPACVAGCDGPAAAVEMRHARFLCCRWWKLQNRNNCLDGTYVGPHFFTELGISPFQSIPEPKYRILDCIFEYTHIRSALHLDEFDSNLIVI